MSKVKIIGKIDLSQRSRKSFAQFNESPTPHGDEWAMEDEQMFQVLTRKSYQDED